MLVRSLRQHWPARRLEWLMAGFVSLWGLYVLLNPELFTQQETAALFSGLAAVSAPFTIYPALAWGGAGFLIGLIRAVALFINGAYTRTPVVRLGTSFLSMFIITQIIIGVWKSGVPNTDLIVYPLFLIADLLSAYRASIDMMHAEKQREVQKENHRHVSRASARLAA